jgi:hypothetical protein
LRARAGTTAVSRHNALVLFFALAFVVQKACAAVRVLHGVRLVSIGSFCRFGVCKMREDGVGTYGFERFYCG